MYNIYLKTCFHLAYYTCIQCIVHKISISKTMNIFPSVHQKPRRSGTTLRIFDVCNQEKRQVIWHTYLRNDALGYLNCNHNLLTPSMPLVQILLQTFLSHTDPSFLLYNRIPLYLRTVYAQLYVFDILMASYLYAANNSDKAQPPAP